MTGEKAAQLIRRVSARQQVGALGARFHRLVLALGGIYLLLLCTGRLLGLFPHALTLWTLLLVPLLALTLALLFLRRPPPAATARLIDERMKTQDLYLTAVMIDHAIGEYKPLVLQAAEERAATIRAAEAAPLYWRRGARDAGLLLSALLLGVLYLPTLDPFGKQTAQQKAVERRKELEKSIQATALRAELLKKDTPTTDLSKDAQQRLDDLKKTFDQAKPTEQKTNLAALQQNQKELADLWRKDNERKLKDAFDRTPPAQQFGAASPKTAEWKEGLQKGAVAAMNKELEELNQMAAKLAQMPEGVEKDKLREQMKERLKEMADFMAREANAMPAAAALKRATDQLAMAATKGMDKEAMKALQQSLKLTEMELNALAQNVRDLNALEEGLKAAQLAKRLNDMGNLDGDQNAGEMKGQGMASYAKLYAKLLAQGRAGQGDGEGEGGGMGDRGHGRGGVAPEDPSLKTDYSTEQSKSALTAGKILLQWKTQELADPGEARANYLDQVAAVRSGAAEAVLKEQVPPGYHQAISKYFDTMGESGAGKKTP